MWRSKDWIVKIKICCNYTFFLSFHNNSSYCNETLRFEHSLTIFHVLVPRRVFLCRQFSFASANALNVYARLLWFLLCFFFVFVYHFHRSGRVSFTFPLHLFFYSRALSKVCVLLNLFVCCIFFHSYARSLFIWLNGKCCIFLLSHNKNSRRWFDELLSVCEAKNFHKRVLQAYTLWRLVKWNNRGRQSENDFQLYLIGHMIGVMYLLTFFEWVIESDRFSFFLLSSV